MLLGESLDQFLPISIGKGDATSIKQPICVVVKFDSSGIHSKTPLNDTSASFATFSSDSVDDDSVLVFSNAVQSDLRSVKQITLYSPKNPLNFKLLVESEKFDTFRMFQTESNLIGLSGRRILMDSNVLDLKKPLKEHISKLSLPKDANEDYSSIGILKFLNSGEFLWINKLLKTGGIPDGRNQILVVNANTQTARLGPEVSPQVMSANLSHDSKKLVVLSVKKPQLLIYSLPSFEVEHQIDYVLEAPTSVCVY